MIKVQKLLFSLLVVLAISTSLSIYLFQSRRQAMKLLGNDNYVIGKIHEEIGGEFEFIKLYEPMIVRQNHDIRDWVKRHSTSNIVRVFIAYLRDPETSKAEENEFYFGFIDTHGNIYTLPKNHLLI